MSSRAMEPTIKTGISVNKWSMTWISASVFSGVRTLGELQRIRPMGPIRPIRRRTYRSHWSYKSYPLPEPIVCHNCRRSELCPPASEIRFDGSYLGVRVGRSQKIRYDTDAFGARVGHFSQIAFFYPANTENRNPDLSVNFS